MNRHSDVSEDLAHIAAELASCNLDPAAVATVTMPADKHSRLVTELMRVSVDVQELEGLLRLATQRRVDGPPLEPRGTLDGIWSSSDSMNELGTAEGARLRTSAGRTTDEGHRDVSSTLAVTLACLAKYVEDHPGRSDGACVAIPTALFDSYMRSLMSIVHDVIRLEEDGPS